MMRRDTTTLTPILYLFFFFKQKTAYEMIWLLEFRRVLFRSRRAGASAARGRAGDRRRGAAPGRTARLPPPLRPGGRVEALDRPPPRVRHVGRAPSRGPARRPRRPPHPARGA